MRGDFIYIKKVQSKVLCGKLFYLNRKCCFWDKKSI